MARKPRLDGATGWINSPPLRPDELQGHVLLVNFWTLTCINWLRTMPHIRAWSRAYRDDGLIVVGVHTPEFSLRAPDIELVDQAAPSPRDRLSGRRRQRLRGLERLRQPLLAGRLPPRRGRHPAWPALRRRQLRTGRAGDPTAPRRRAAARDRARHGSRSGGGLAAPAQPRDLPGPGCGPRTSRSADGSADRRASTAPFLNRFCASQPLVASRCVDHRSGARAAPPARRIDRLPVPRPRRTPRAVHVRPPSQFPSGCSSTVPSPDRTTASTSTRTASACLREGRMYQLVRTSGDVRERTLEVIVLRPRRAGSRLHVRVEPRTAPPTMASRAANRSSDRP